LRTRAVSAYASEAMRWLPDADIDFASADTDTGSFVAPDATAGSRILLRSDFARGPFRRTRRRPCAGCRTRISTSHPPTPTRARSSPRTRPPARASCSDLTSHAGRFGVRVGGHALVAGRGYRLRIRRHRHGLVRRPGRDRRLAHLAPI